jgi:hypothetical protein
METRRSLLAGAAGLCVALAGCSGDGGDGDGPRGAPGPRDPGDGGADPSTPTATPDPVPNLSIDGWETAAADDGSLRLRMTVVNDGNAVGEGLLVVSLRAGDRRFERDREVTVPVGETGEVEFAFPVARSDFFADGGFDTTWRSL